MMSEPFSDPHDDDVEKPNPFDPKKLRIGQRFGEGQDVRRVLVSVLVRKPHRQEFFRTHPDPEMTLQTAILEFKQDRQSFIIAPELAPYLPGEAVAKLLIPTLTNHGSLCLWPIRLPDEQGRLDEWNAVAIEAAERAKTKWVRLMANMGAGTYDVLEARGQFPDPVWPVVTLEKLLELAFKDRVIEDLGHPVLKRLRGEF
jgi:hypothetical protein